MGVLSEWYDLPDPGRRASLAEEDFESDLCDLILNLQDLPQAFETVHLPDEWNREEEHRGGLAAAIGLRLLQIEQEAEATIRRLRASYPDGVLPSGPMEVIALLEAAAAYDPPVSSVDEDDRDQRNRRTQLALAGSAFLRAKRIRHLIEQGRPLAAVYLALATLAKRPLALVESGLKARRGAAAGGRQPRAGQTLSREDRRSLAQKAEAIYESGKVEWAVAYKRAMRGHEAEHGIRLLDENDCPIEGVPAPAILARSHRRNLGLPAKPRRRHRASAPPAPRRK